MCCCLICESHSLFSNNFVCEWGWGEDTNFNPWTNFHSKINCRRSNKKSLKKFLLFGLTEVYEPPPKVKRQSSHISNKFFPPPSQYTYRMIIFPFWLLMQSSFYLRFFFKLFYHEILLFSPLFFLRLSKNVLFLISVLEWVRLWNPHKENYIVTGFMKRQ